MKAFPVPSMAETIKNDSSFAAPSLVLLDPPLGITSVIPARSLSIMAVFWRPFVFGATDSSYILNLFTDPHDFPTNLPYDGDYIIRSKNYSAITYVPSEDSDKNTQINATVKFDYNNLIQIYAGPDNLPYTKDDVFVYEPNYYNRLTVDVLIQ